MKATDNVRGNERLRMTEHFIRHGDGRGGWTVEPSLYRIVRLGEDTHLFPYGIHLMDNDELLLLSGLRRGDGFSCVAALSSDLGDTWSDQVDTGVYGRPVATAHLGNGTIVFANETLSREDLAPQWTMSDDYGRTWKRIGPMPRSPDGHIVFGEGNVHVDDTAPAGASRMIQTVAFHTDFPVGRHTAFVRSSTDCAHTWTDEISPSEWVWEVDYLGKRFERSVCEGTLVRAKNGWLVAALRTDMPPRYFDAPNDDSLMGLATSVSRDDGTSWSPLTVLYDAGRHHPSLLLLPNGDIVMTYIVRADVRDGRLASLRRGCEAVISHDNGLSWNTGRTRVLDEYEYFDGSKWYNGQSGHLSSTLLPDGSILTAYGNYLSKGCALIRWKT